MTIRSGLGPQVFAMIVTALVISGCSDSVSKWSHPEVPADQWSSDAAQCKYAARRDAEDEYLRDRAGSDVNLRDDSVDAYLERSSIEKRTRKLFSFCMRSLGYQPVED